MKFALKLYLPQKLRPFLELSLVLWNSTQIGLVESLERIQRMFLSIIGYKRKLHGRVNPLVSMYLSSIQASINSESLATMRKSIDFRFMSKLINGIIPFPDLLYSLHFNFPQFNSRHFSTFSIPFHRFLYGYYNFLDLIARKCNELRYECI
jgi:hypothetical protein